MSLEIMDHSSEFIKFVHPEMQIKNRSINEIYVVVCLVLSKGPLKFMPQEISTYLLVIFLTSTKIVYFKINQNILNISFNFKRKRERERKMRFLVCYVLVRDKTTNLYHTL